MERLFEVRNVGVEYVCDACKEGTMHVAGNICLASDPPKYPHICNKCGHHDSLPAKYPTFRVERVETAVGSLLHQAAL